MEVKRRHVRPKPKTFNMHKEEEQNLKVISLRNKENVKPLRCILLQLIISCLSANSFLEIQLHWS